MPRSRKFCSAAVRSAHAEIEATEHASAALDSALDTLQQTAAAHLQSRGPTIHTRTPATNTRHTQPHFIDRPRPLFYAALPARTASAPTPRNPPERLRLEPSHLRPLVAAGERLLAWKPSRDFRGSAGDPTGADFEHVQGTMAEAFTYASLASYGAGLSLFHKFCDNNGIPENQRAPANNGLITSFLAALAGSYSGSTLSNYFAGIHTWHILHNVPWEMDQEQVKLLFKAARKLAPATSKRSKRQPYTVATLTAIRAQLDLDSPRDAAVWCCATTLLYGVARTGEFTTSKLCAFDPAVHVQRSGIREDTDRQGHKVTVLRVPFTKCAAGGEDIFWAAQRGPTDPEFALHNHLRVNQPGEGEHLLSYSHEHSRRPLTRTLFLSCIKSASIAAGLKYIPGHGFRIGGTLEYLLRGVPFEVVKAKGRWASNAFLIYLREHAQVMAPFMQDDPGLHAAFVNLTLPPVR